MILFMFLLCSCCVVWGWGVCGGVSVTSSCRRLPDSYLEVFFQSELFSLVLLSACVNDEALFDYLLRSYLRQTHQLLSCSLSAVAARHLKRFKDKTGISDVPLNVDDTDLA